MHAQTHFPEYFDVVADSMKFYGGQECVDRLEEAYKKVRYHFAVFGGICTTCGVYAGVLLRQARLVCAAGLLTRVRCWCAVVRRWGSRHPVPNASKPPTILQVMLPHSFSLKTLHRT